MAALAKVWRCLTVDCPVVGFAPGPLCPHCGQLGAPLPVKKHPGA